MKRILLQSVFCISIFCVCSLSAQTTATFESLTLSPDSYWDGSSAPLGATFMDGNTVYRNYYDTAFGGYWSSGWAYSNMKDSVTSGFSNMYSSRAGSGYNGSANFAVGKDGAITLLSGIAAGKVVNGVYISNTTYAANSMRDGDSFAKKFGGTTGDDPDWFKLTIKKYYGGVLGSDSIEFYLADYRFTNNSQDYIVTDWRFVDLTSLGNVDSLVFELSSSDVGSFGMNTPGFFVADNFTTADAGVGVFETDGELELLVYPNPSSDFINLKNVQSGSFYEITDITGRMILNGIFNTSSSIDISNFPMGLYNLRFTNQIGAGNISFVKQ